VRRRPLADRLFGWAAGRGLADAGLLAGILVSLLIGAWPAIEQVRPGLPHQQRLGPGQGRVRRPGDDLRHLATSLIALVIAVPVSFGIALFLTELSPAWLKRPLGTAIELLAAVPSIVYGMWGLLVFGPILATYVQQPLQSRLRQRRAGARRAGVRALRWASASCRPASSWPS
jgi:phosphate transport system permease protein